MTKTRLALVGAGVIGKRHMEAVGRCSVAELVALADPSVEAVDIAAKFGVPLFQDTVSMLNAIDADGVIVATPTEHHFDPTVETLRRGIHVLVEKPIMSTLAEAENIIAESERANRQVLVGHHRRYYGLVQRAHEILHDGTIGQLVAVSGQWNVRKHDTYYHQEWRRKWQAGPILTNLIHDMDLIRYLAGPVSSMVAETANTVMGCEKEDAAALVMRFENGALGTFILSDQSHSPWGWEQATGENPIVPRSGQNALRFMGTKGSLDFPNLTVWTTRNGEANWNAMLEPEDISVELEDALERQIIHFCEVINGTAKPRITARDATDTLKATLAVLESAKTGMRVEL